MNKEILELIESLARIHFASLDLLTQIKTKKALAKIKHARTLLDQASKTLAWAQCSRK
jgi:hypothetical protein